MEQPACVAFLTLVLLSGTLFSISFDFIIADDRNSHYENILRRVRLND
ncbi:hypothetical protein EDWATA_03251 [Edwardsiella tarda ATCC 23685]|uniref:Uncharacterized protein n=1 Tax=Edwardsiella tarda ATCC 23685 TaxID=500638 RepID=D4F8Z6_EDWTA|nr:hypothetical protein EDWATA_03251 [Edwardsiella tarda ATCC 23685]